MSDEMRLEVYRTRQSMQDRYVYFLLAAAGAAVGFAVTQTTTAVITSSKAPLALAVLCWGLSFFFGCESLKFASSVVFKNATLLEIRAGEHPLAGTNLQFIEFAASEMRKYADVDGSKGGRRVRWQFRLFVAGAAFYIAWHVLEMWLRTPALRHP